MKTVIQFSGGKDSLACLYLTRPRWDDITVLWCNTGAMLPEVMELIDRVRNMVPHFVEITTDQAAQRKEKGLPVDVLPMRHHAQIQFYAQQETTPRMQSFMECCVDNIMLPMGKWVSENGVTHVIRGQKKADKHKGPMTSGTEVDGVTYSYPIEGWTDAEVMAYLKEVGAVIPSHYEYFNSSMDCWNCTAFLAENVGKMQYLRDKHPEKHKQLEADLLEIKGVIAAGLQDIERFITCRPS